MHQKAKKYLDLAIGGQKPKENEDGIIFVDEMKCFVPSSLTQSKIGEDRSNLLSNWREDISLPIAVFIGTRSEIERLRSMENLFDDINSDPSVPENEKNYLRFTKISSPFEFRMFEHFNFDGLFPEKTKKCIHVSADTLSNFRDELKAFNSLNLERDSFILAHGQTLFWEGNSQFKSYFTCFGLNKFIFKEMSKPCVEFV